MSWETVIGLEIHAQLSTKSKLFSGGSTEFGAESNTHVDLVDMGLPGVLPVANKEAFYKAIRFGLATGAEINQTSSFDRKDFSGLTISILNSSLIKLLRLLPFFQLFL